MLAREEAAQSTLEAALLLPAFLTLLLLSLQPLCVLYTRSIMEVAAGETTRLMATAESTPEESCKAFALRRLSAVPDISIFHTGGSRAWDIEVSGAKEGEGSVTVSITGSVTPLPVLGAFVGALGKANGDGDIEIAVEVAYAARPEWLKGSYESWVKRWH